MTNFLDRTWLTHIIRRIIIRTLVSLWYNCTAPHKRFSRLNSISKALPRGTSRRSFSPQYTGISIRYTCTFIIIIFLRGKVGYIFIYLKNKYLYKSFKNPLVTKLVVEERDRYPPSTSFIGKSVISLTQYIILGM